MASLTDSLPASASAASSFSTNVGQSERVASGVAGGLMAVYGLTRGSLGGLLIAATGAAVACRRAPP